MNARQTLGLQIALNICALAFSQTTTEQCKKQVTDDYDPTFHMKLKASTSTLNLKSVYINDTLTIFYKSGTADSLFTFIQTNNFNDFTDENNPSFPANAKDLTIIYDDDNRANFGDSSTLIAIFQDQSNKQNLAYSTDIGKSWNITCTDNACFNISLSNTVAVNWNNDLGKWMAEDTKSNIYTSSNLQNWTLLQSKITTSYLGHDDLFPISLIRSQLTGNSSGNKWIIIESNAYSNYYYYQPGPSYYINDMNATGIVQTNITSYQLDYGNDLQSISVATDGNSIKEEKILVGSISLKTLVTIPVEWSDILITPRKVTLEQFPDKLYLVQTPLGDFKSRSKGSHQYRNVEIQPGCNPLSCFHSLSYSIGADINLNTATRVGFIVRKSISQGTEIGYDHSRGYYVDRRNSGFPTGANLDLIHSFVRLYSSSYKVTDGIAKFIILVDVSVIEVFCETGIVVFSLLVFPSRESDSLELFSQGGTAITSYMELDLFDG